MIYLIKDARDQKTAAKSKLNEIEEQVVGEDSNIEEEKDRLSSEHSMPFDSDSDSVFEHCDKYNYLDRNESMAMDMRFCNEAHHIK